MPCRSQLNPDILAKQKSFMNKYQIAVKSPLDEYVRSAATSAGEEPCNYRTFFPTFFSYVTALV